MKRLGVLVGLLLLALILTMPAVAQAASMNKKIRIAYCGIHEEVNTFATETMGFAKVTGNMATGFQKFEGEGLIKEYKGTSTWPGGWVDAFLESPEVEFIPLALYNYTAGPIIQGEAYQKMKKDILDSLKAAMPLDGVAMAVIPGLMQAFDANQMKLVGFDPRDYRVVVVKSANHFRAWWPVVASEIIDCDPPGIASNDLTSFDYKRKTRKVYPLDKDTVYPEKTTR